MSLAELLQNLKGFEWVDLSHTLEANIPAWPTHARFSKVLHSTYEWGDAACHYGLTMSEHTGTHADAPCHFIPDGKTLDQLPVDNLAGRAVTLSFPDLAPGAAVTAEMLEEASKAAGVMIAPGDIVLLRFGWDRLWALGREGRGFTAGWPGLAGSGARLLADRGVKAVGCDVVAIDASGAAQNPAHYELLGRGVLIIENLTNLDRLTAESLFLALPLKIGGGTGSPVRAVGLIPRS